MALSVGAAWMATAAEPLQLWYRQPAAEWVEALPRHKEGQFQSVRVGFRKGQLAALEILDSFGQRSRLEFAQFESKVTLPATRFQFTPPAGADVLKQP